MSKDSLGDRMKFYERVGAVEKFMPTLPVIVRLDGRAFHSFTKGLKRPYDIGMSRLMIDTTKYLVEITNAVIGYTQSDEITLILYSSTFASQIYFDGRRDKINSILSASASVFFNKYNKLNDKTGLFDCRSYQVPNRVEAINTLIWREQDATRNSIQMAGQSVYSHKELQGKSCNEIQEMLWQKGINWNEYPSFFKRGTYYQRKYNDVSVTFTKEELDKLPEKHHARTNPGIQIYRTEFREIEMPPIMQVENKEGVVFHGETPIRKLGGTQA